MEKKSKNLKRIAGLAWLLAAFLVTLATAAAQVDSYGMPGNTDTARMGVLLGGPIRGGG